MLRSRKTDTPPTSRRHARTSAPLGPGLHGGVIEVRSEDRYRVRTTAGSRVSAELLPSVQPALAAECLRSGRMVLLVDTARGPAIAGALQTCLAVERDRDGVVAVDATELRFKAAHALSIEVGSVAIRAHEDGEIRMEGDRMILDMAALVRILSARVELP